MKKNNVTYIHHHKIEYLDETHSYIVDGEEVPSVSTLVELASKKYSWDDYSLISQDVLDNAAKEGTIMHKIIENYEKYDVEPFEGFIDEFNNYLSLKEKYGIKCLKNEQIVLFCDDYDKPIYCGRLDMIISRDFSKGICDLKRTSRLYEDKVFFQLNLYSLAYTQSYGENIDFLSCIRLYKASISEYVETEIDFNTTINHLRELIVDFDEKYEITHMLNNGPKERLYEISNGKLIKYNGSEKEITVPNNVRIIGKKSFSFSSLECVNVSSNVYKIEDEAFELCKDLKRVTFDGVIDSIGVDAFSYCDSLESMIIPNGIKKICYDAFASCKSLKKILIPNSIKMFEGCFFHDCKELLYNEFENSLYLGDEENPYLILSSIKDYEISIFSTNERTRFINCYALADNDNVEIVKLNESVEYIGEAAFAECVNIKKVYYFGNEKSRNKIIVRSNNDFLLSAKWFCFTKNGSKERKIGNWWYYDTDGITIIEKCIN